MTIQWKVGDVVRRITEKHASAMPLGLGVVTAVDESDKGQPVRIGEWFWPGVEDIVLEFTSEEQTRQEIIALAAKQCGISGDSIRQLATVLAAEGFRKFEIVEEDV